MTLSIVAGFILGVVATVLVFGLFLAWAVYEVEE